MSDGSGEGGSDGPGAGTGAPLSLYHLLDPEVLADPYPLYRRLRDEDPVHWDPYLHAWVVTRYPDVATVLRQYRAARTPDPQRLAALGMGELAPIAEVMVRQMLFLDPPEHGRVRRLASVAFTPRQVARLRDHIRSITEKLVADLAGAGRMEVMAGLANPLPAIVTAEMLGVPTADHDLLKGWSQDFAEMLGNFQHNPGRARRVLRSVDEMVAYFRAAVRAARDRPAEGLISALTNAEVDGDRLSEEEVVANVIVTMVGGQETTTNLIGNGLLTLLRQPQQLRRLREDPALMPLAVEELLRYESPSQHTARLAPAGAQLGGVDIPEGAAVIAVMGAANRDPEQFPEPDRLDLGRKESRHLAFGWAGHFCFGAPLARVEGHIAFETLLARFRHLELDGDRPVTWRPNLGLRGLTELHVLTA
ncbi:MAG TPA: cytochrome P450 [Acidimicrobiales bacterium]|nr:cytochrome P450 [Acidimicrobiales bacterium]